MKVKDILDKNTIKIGMKAKNKKEVIDELSDLLLKNDYINELESYKKDIYEREKVGQTGIGNYIAIPHGRSSSVQKVGVAIGITDEEIEWETVDDRGVKVIILFAVGDTNDGADTHLKILSLFARKLGNDEIIERVLNAKNSEDVIEAFS